jgi:hypothetical protein
MTLQDHIAHIDRMQEEVRAFSAEIREAIKGDSRMLPFTIGGMILGAAIFTWGMVFMRVLGA